MTKYLARSWEQVFSAYIRKRLDILAETFAKTLASFRIKMAKRPQLKAASSFALATRQVMILETTIKDTTKLILMVNTGQKEASRLFIPVITSEMSSAYAYCTQESGPGCYKRIKAHVLEHVESVRDTMFRAATQKTEACLRNTIDQVEAEIKDTVEGILSLISRDYTALLANQSLFKALSTARDEIWLLLSQVDQRFEKALQAFLQPASPNRTDEITAMGADH
ncbi:hypothetical protein VTI74DRAFT_7700 [Chaetomium olivicolor]